MESFSSKLIKARKDGNLTIEEISEKTKIREHIIRAMEEGDFASLEPVYAKSFIKTYAGFLNIPGDVTNSALERIFKIEEPPKPAEPVEETKEEKPKTRKLDKASLNNIFYGEKDKENAPKYKKILKYVIYVVIGIAIVSLIIFLFRPGQTGNTNYLGSEGNALNDSGLVKALQDKPVVKFKLEAKSVDTAATTFKIHIDSETDETISLAPGTKKEWEAVEKFELSGVTVGSIEFYRDGELLKPFGEKGSIIRNISIYKDKIKSSALSDAIISDSLSTSDSSSVKSDSNSSSSTGTSSQDTVKKEIGAGNPLTPGN